MSWTGTNRQRGRDPVIGLSYQDRMLEAMRIGITADRVFDQSCSKAGIDLQEAYVAPLDTLELALKRGKTSSSV